MAFPFTFTSPPPLLPSAFSRIHLLFFLPPIYSLQLCWHALVHLYLSFSFFTLPTSAFIDSPTPLHFMFNKNYLTKLETCVNNPVVHIPWFLSINLLTFYCIVQEKVLNYLCLAQDMSVQSINMDLSIFYPLKTSTIFKCYIHIYIYSYI